MANIDIDLIDPSGGAVRVRLPDDRPISRLSEAICRKLRLSTADERGSLRLPLLCFAAGRTLHPDMTLAEEGVREGHALHIRMCPAERSEGVVVITEQDLNMDDAGGVDTASARLARSVPHQQGMGPFGRTRSPAATVVTVLVTLGLYGAVWFAMVWSEARRYAHGRNGVRISRPISAFLLHVLAPLLLAAAAAWGTVWVDSIHADNAGYYRRLRSTSSPKYVPPPPFSNRDADNAIAAGAVCVGLAMMLGLLGQVRTPGLIRKMRLAMGVAKPLAGCPGLIGLLTFIPCFGGLIWLYVTQTQLNKFWRIEAVR